MVDFLETIGILAFLAIPILIVIFVVRLIKKKPKKWIGLSAIFCFIGVIVFFSISTAVEKAGMTEEERIAYEQELQESREQQLAEKEAEKKAKDEAKKKVEENKESDPIRDGAYDGELTILFDFGEINGNFTGELLNGLPSGYGEFDAKPSDGTRWTYKGQWDSGHMHGEGETKWRDGRKQIGIYENDYIVPMTESEIEKLFTKPEDYLYHYVELTGEVLTVRKYDDDGITVQMYADYENRDDSFMVKLNGSGIDVDDDDFIKVVGTVEDVFEGRNLLGNELIMPHVNADKYEIITYEQLHPVIASIDVNQTQTQLGYSITIQKVEVTDIETRIYIKVENNGENNFSLYAYSTTVIQSAKQYEMQNNWDADYPEVQTDLYPGVTTEGVITYPPIMDENFKYIIKASSDDYREKIEEYIFEISFDTN